MNINKVIRNKRSKFNKNKLENKKLTCQKEYFKNTKKMDKYLTILIRI